MDTGVETFGGKGLSIRLLGPLSVLRDGASVPLPRSRKVRALLGFLALTPEPVARSTLCDLLWEVPNDPRGELRWCLSKLRGVLGPDEHRLTTPSTDHVALDVSGCFVDAVAVQRALKPGVDQMKPDALADVCALFGGELLGGLHVEGSAGFYGWLTAQRQRFRTLQIAVLQELVRHSPLGSEEMFGRLDRWLQVAPFDLHPHEIMLEALAQRGRLHDAQEHLAKTMQLFEEEGIDTSSLRDKWRSVRRGPRRSSAPSPAQVVSQLVGRSQEWARLSKMWTEAGEGRASLLLLTGAAGIGKTRLAEDFVASEAARGAATVRATCYVADRPMAYAAVADWLRSPALRPVLDGLPVAQLSQLARVMPGILLDRPDVPPPPPFTESWQRVHFFEALARALLASPAPLLAFVDDVQWCDPETIEWLRYVMHFDPRARIMVIATARTGDVATEHPVAGMLRDLRRDERGAEIALGPLSAADTASLAAKIASGLTGSREQELYEKTRGNPLFIVEFVRAGLGEGEGDAVPPKVHAVIRTRFSQLGATTREIASLGAVVGRPFSSELLAKVSGGSEDSVSSGIDELWQRRLIQAHGSGTYDFTHGLVRDVCYAELGPERRRSLHRRVAQALAALHGADSDVASSIIAEHFERGGQPSEAVPHLERAAVVARLRYAEPEAIAFLERALGLLDQLEPGSDRDRREVRLLASLAHALMGTRGYAAPEIGRTLARARALSDTLEDDPHRFAVLSGSFMHHAVRADLDLARTIATSCLHFGTKAGDTAMVGGARLALGCSAFHLGEIAQADEQFLAGMASVGDDPTPRASHEFGGELGVFCRAYRGHTRWLLGDAAGAQKASGDAMARAEALSHPFSLAIALAYDAMLQQFRGEPELTWRRADAAEAQCRKYGFIYYLSWTPILRGWARARLGSVVEGMAEMRSGYASLLETGARLRVPYYLALMAAVSLESGDRDEASRFVEEGRAAAHRTGERWQDAELARLGEASSLRQ